MLLSPINGVVSSGDYKTLMVLIRNHALQVKTTGHWYDNNKNI